MSSVLENVLERLYEKYNHRKFIPPDPLQFIYKYKTNKDKEIAGFFASALAYGRVEQIEKSLEDLFGRMGASPFEFVVNFNSESAKKIEGFKHRFNTADDICDVCAAIKKALNKYGSLGNCFLKNYSKNDENILGSLEGFCVELIALAGRKRGSGVEYLLSRPSKGSGCKRLNLFLRWMVRKDAVDSGIWKKIDKSKLIVPIDVHMARLTKILGFHDRKTVNLKGAVEITRRFAEICPDDPVKYDFALCRIGILEDCSGKYRKQCELCELLGYCKKRNLKFMEKKLG